MTSRGCKCKCKCKFDVKHRECLRDHPSQRLMKKCRTSRSNWNLEMFLNGYPMETVKYHMNDVIEKHQNKPKDPVQTVKKKEVLIVLPFLGYHSKDLTKLLRSCVNKFFGIFSVKIVFQNTRRIKSFFPYKDKLAISFRSKVVYRANF